MPRCPSAIPTLEEILDQRELVEAKLTASGEEPSCSERRAFRTFTGMAFSAIVRRLALVPFVAIAALSVHACAGDRLVLPDIPDATILTGDAAGPSCVKTQCGDECVDTTTDPRHCGNCTTACGVDQICTGGACKSNPCPAANPNLCGTGASAVCTNFKTDPNHCGDCATSCGTDGGVCNNGSCGAACSALETTCGGDGSFYCHKPTAPNDCCGTLCLPNKDCTAGGCVTCTPKLEKIPNTPAAPGLPYPADPNALKVSCPQPCPVVRCGGVMYMFYSYVDNRSSFGMVGLDSNGGVIRPVVEIPGDRYLDSIIVNDTDKTVTVIGQAALADAGIPGVPVKMFFSDFQQ
jgi:hypothetical protein